MNSIKWQGRNSFATATIDDKALIYRIKWLMRRHPKDIQIIDKKGDATTFTFPAKYIHLIYPKKEPKKMPRKS